MSTFTDQSRTASPAPDAQPSQRPGVPMETDPDPDSGAHWHTPDAQHSDVTVFTRAGGPGLTPVYGTAQPPGRISGAVRGFAYRIPETRASHWMTLLTADRVDQWEHRLAGMARGDVADWRSFARNLAGHPVRSALLAIGIGLVARRIIGGR